MSNNFQEQSKLHSSASKQAGFSAQQQHFQQRNLEDTSDLQRSAKSLDISRHQYNMNQMGNGNWSPHPSIHQQPPTVTDDSVRDGRQSVDIRPGDSRTSSSSEQNKGSHFGMALLKWRRKPLNGQGSTSPKILSRFSPKFSRPALIATSSGTFTQNQNGKRENVNNTSLDPFTETLQSNTTKKFTLSTMDLEADQAYYDNLKTPADDERRFDFDISNAVSTDGSMTRGSSKRLSKMNWMKRSSWSSTHSANSRHSNSNTRKRMSMKRLSGLSFAGLSRTEESPEETSPISPFSGSRYMNQEDLVDQQKPGLNDDDVMSPFTSMNAVLHDGTHDEDGKSIHEIMTFDNGKDTLIDIGLKNQEELCTDPKTAIDVPIEAHESQTLMLTPAPTPDRQQNATVTSQTFISSESDRDKSRIDDSARNDIIDSYFGSMTPLSVFSTPSIVSEGSSNDSPSGKRRSKRKKDLLAMFAEALEEADTMTTGASQTAPVRSGTFEDKNATKPDAPVSTLDDEQPLDQKIKEFKQENQRVPQDVFAEQSEKLINTNPIAEKSNQVVTYPSDILLQSSTKHLLEKSLPDQPYIPHHSRNNSVDLKNIIMPSSSSSKSSASSTADLAEFFRTTSPSTNPSDSKEKRKKSGFFMKWSRKKTIPKTKPTPLNERMPIEMDDSHQSNRKTSSEMTLTKSVDSPLYVNSNVSESQRGNSDANTSSVSMEVVPSFSLPEGSNVSFDHNTGLFYDHSYGGYYDQHGNYYHPHNNQAYYSHQQQQSHDNATSGVVSPISTGTSAASSERDPLSPSSNEDLQSPSAPSSSHIHVKPIHDFDGSEHPIERKPTSYSNNNNGRKKENNHRSAVIVAPATDILSPSTPSSYGSFSDEPHSEEEWGFGDVEVVFPSEDEDWFDYMDEELLRNTEYNATSTFLSMKLAGMQESKSKKPSKGLGVTFNTSVEEISDDGSFYGDGDEDDEFSEGDYMYDRYEQEPEENMNIEEDEAILSDSSDHPLVQDQRVPNEQHSHDQPVLKRHTEHQSTTSYINDQGQRVDVVKTEMEDLVTYEAHQRRQHKQINEDDEEAAAKSLAAAAVAKANQYQLPTTSDEDRTTLAGIPPAHLEQKWMTPPASPPRSNSVSPSISPANVFSSIPAGTGVNLGEQTKRKKRIRHVQTQTRQQVLYVESSIQTEAVEDNSNAALATAQATISVLSLEKSQLEDASSQRIQQLEQRIRELLDEREDMFSRLDAAREEADSVRASKEKVVLAMEENKAKFDRLSAQAYKKIKELLTDRQVMEIEIKALRKQLTQLEGLYIEWANVA